MKTLICLMTLIFSMSLFAQEKKKKPLKAKYITTTSTKSTEHLTVTYFYRIFYNKMLIGSILTDSSDLQSKNRQLATLQSIDDEQFVEMTRGGGFIATEDPLAKLKAQIKNLKAENKKLKIKSISPKVLTKDNTELEKLKIDNAVLEALLKEKKIREDKLDGIIASCTGDNTELQVKMASLEQVQAINDKKLIDNGTKKFIKQYEAITNKELVNKK